MSLIGRLKQSLPPGLKSRLRETRHQLGPLRNKARVDDDLADHDPFWHCRAIEPCAYCRKTGQGKAAAKP